jgi:putative glutamine amidotransferase
MDDPDEIARSYDRCSVAPKFVHLSIHVFRNLGDYPAMKPLIGVTTSELRPGELATLRRHGEPPHAEMALGITYVRAIEQAGGIPVVMPPLPLADVPALVDRLDGIVLSGGPDLAPAAYDALPHPELGTTEPALDAFEYAVVREAFRLDLPILGICRGAQALNVARGGALHQHLPEVVGDAVVHRQSEDGRNPTHVVEIVAGTKLAGILGARRLAVNSFHHQAVRRLGRGLRVCARADDGTIEAIEDPARPFVLAVQWHAETLEDRSEQPLLFDELVAVAAGVRRLPLAA